MGASGSDLSWDKIHSATGQLFSEKNIGTTAAGLSLAALPWLAGHSPFLAKLGGAAAVKSLMGKSDEEKEYERLRELQAQALEKLAALSEGDLPSSLTDPIEEKYSNLAEQQGNFLAGQFGAAGLGGTNLYRDKALGLQQSLGKQYTRELGDLQYKLQMGALGQIMDMQPEYYQPGYADVIESLGLLGSE